MKNNKLLGLHIVTDFPGPYAPPWTTLAIHDCITAVSDVINSVVLVPRRTRSPSRTQIIAKQNELHIQLFDPVATMLPDFWQRLDWINLVKANLLGQVKPNFVHSHKLSYEARIGDLLASYFNVPHIITIRGSSDTHHRHHWPWTRMLYRNILTRSRLNLWLSVWARSIITNKTGYHPTAKDIEFPNAVPLGALYAQQVESNPKRNSLVCICRLDLYKQKGIVALLRGLASACSKITDLTLDLIGPCGEQAQKILQDSINNLGLSKNVRLLGPMARHEVIGKLGNYAAMIMLSRNETFELVYAEALLSGVPIVYLRGSGVDGYEFAKEYGIACKDLSTTSIYAALIEMSLRQPDLHNQISAALSSGKLDFLTSPGQAKLYSKIISQAVGH
ncbi:glycosyltransferase family 4 protein [Nitrosomonas sp. Nm132]|uniref:glycosyltransferase family 4 protein n=1 Tax=Nitrosomonas sp. Nm132 TaxID=1881053 RepID=UPI00088694A7|nr:glycosyltransferase family 4 protein [Nitrosomonas sp. Nm132]SDH98310.1 Glycosyltransferase involved in cell wall bisynthesis [Nitrosomonas sp. Nm132]